LKPVRAYVNFLAYLVNRGLSRGIVDNQPVMAFVDPTTFCNLRCPACPTGAQAGLRKPATLDLELYRAFIDEVGDYLFKLYLYNLGEPLLHKQAPELVALARARDIFVMLSSNLSLALDDVYCERLVASGLDVLIVPLDGASPDTYAKYRRRGDFELVRSNMRRIQAAKARLGSSTPRVVWQFLVFAHNQHEIETMRQQYREWGADDYWVAGAYMPIGAEAEGFAPPGLAQFDIYHGEHLHRRKTERAAARGKACSWLYGVATLNPDGRVSPCCYVPAEKDDFAVYTPPARFLDVFNAPSFVEARSLFRTPGFWQAGESWEALVHRMDGRAMGVASTLGPGEAVCRKCPVPFLQDVVDDELAFDLATLIRHIESAPDLTPEDRATVERLTATLRGPAAT
jgi:MoaA/NifB/PqqE/SkfB family radical SAM enzyme